MRVFSVLFPLVTLAVHVSSQSTPYHDSGRYKRSEQDIGAIPLSDFSHSSPSAQQADHPLTHHEALNSNTAHGHPAGPPAPYNAVANNRNPNVCGPGQSSTYVSEQPVVPNSNDMQARPQGSGLSQIKVTDRCIYVSFGVCFIVTLAGGFGCVAGGVFSRGLPEKRRR
ncbi:hypothetical protein F5050DRAFT_1062464 [Lentinula boryana]|uniref:Secreted protein n=1 Tax=Lentinula boryana TaxID=40481 RepID=A0ABQ8PZK8_9AGAR|nr:hypothetical protein F5050DRAFT_1062464 [Lentinula boryana]